MAPSSSKQQQQITSRKDDVPMGVTKNGTAFIKKKKKKGAATAASDGGTRRRWVYKDPQNISQLREEIVGCLRDGQAQVLIVVADSYSQRSSILPRYIGDAGFGVGPGQKVACAYFSAYAGMMAARHPPDQSKYNTTVSLKGHHSGASLEFMSANLLLQRMTKGDPDLSSCSAVYVDAADSRTLTTDTLLASLLPLLMRRGPTFPLVLGVSPSAAHQAEKLSAFFGRHCSTRTLFLPPTPPLISYINNEPQGDYSGESLLSAALELHRSEETYGSILLFLGRCTSLKDVRRWFNRKIAKSSNPEDKKLHVVPLYSGDEWEQIYLRRRGHPPGSRLLYILSPEVPDASPVLHGINYVIDPGRAGKRARRISQQSADERAAHLRSADPRLGPPKCLRLYPESVFRDEMPRTATPEILTCNAQDLSIALGKLKLLGVTDPWTFDFIDPPPPNVLATALELMAILPDLSGLTLA